MAVHDKAGLVCQANLGGTAGVSSCPFEDRSFFVFQAAFQPGSGQAG